MSSIAIVLAAYCALILLASLAGGWIPIYIRLTHKRMELAVSFVAGVMLGVGVLHMLPHAIMARADAEAANGMHLHMDHEGIHELLGPILLWVLAGFVIMFLIQRFFHYHHHDAPAAPPIAADSSRPDHGHEHRGHEHHGHGHGHSHDLKWGAAAVGLSLHSLIEGIALASTVEVARHVGTIEGAALAGLGAFLVIFLHKPFDSLTLGALLAMSGRTTAVRHIVNIAFAMLIPVGVFLFYVGVTAAEDSQYIASAALAFSAGTFLCISLSDLLPELQFHRHDRVKLSMSLLAGLTLAWAISVFESKLHHHDHHGHSHTHAVDAGSSVTGHDAHHDCNHDHDHDHVHEDVHQH